MSSFNTSTAYLCDGSNALSPEYNGLILLEGGLSTAGCASAPSTSNRQHSRGPVSLLNVLFVFGVVASLVVASLVRDSMILSAAVQALDQTSTETVIVASGDTVWGIAESHTVEGCTTSQVVDWIESHNDLDGGLINAGQELVVPAATN